jgi:two-component system, NtrC family, sensor kinase
VHRADTPEDLAKRQQAEVELRQAQKLEAVGRLAAGIAHEINTPIQFVGDNTHFMQDAFNDLLSLVQRYRELRERAAAGTVDAALLAAVAQAEEAADLEYLEEEIPKALAQSLEGVGRVASIVRALKEFAHPDSKEKAPADLNQALQSTLTVARSELKYVADVETDFGDVPAVTCQVGDVNQVFLNLLVNAAHAIGDKVGDSGARGRISVRTSAEGDWVTIAIGDTGCGIPEAIRSKVYDPFFTTKEVGRGTGQGLALAHVVIVEQHGGSLSFDSTVGEGTVFYLRLPVMGAVKTREAAA